MSAVSLSRVAVPLPLIIAAGCFIAMVTFGARSSSGLFLLPMTEELGWSREGFAMALAIQNLVWGITQPFAGGFADKFGTGRTLAIGALIYATGLILWSVTPSIELFMLSGGVLMGVGIGTASFGVVMAAFGRAVPKEKRSFVFGVATAASSMGQFVFAPLGQAFISNFGWQMALVYLALIILMVVPLSYTCGGTRRARPAKPTCHSCKPSPKRLVTTHIAC